MMWLKGRLKETNLDGKTDYTQMQKGGGYME